METNQDLPRWLMLTHPSTGIRNLWVQDGLDIVELLEALNNYNNSPSTDLLLINLQHEDTLQGFIDQFDCSEIDILNTDDSVINQVGDLMTKWLHENMYDGNRLKEGFHQLETR
jgi:hypothetical protein